MFNTRLKQELSALREELSSLQQVKESLESEMLALSLDPEGRIEAVNQNFLEEMVYRSGDLLGHAIHGFVPEHVKHDEFQQRFNNALSRGEHFAGTVRLLRGNGKEAWLRSIVQPVRGADGRIKRFSVYSSDLTRTIEASREHENLITALVRSTAVIEFDLNGNVLVANDRFLQGMGYSLAQIQGKHHRLFCKPELANSQEYTDFWRRLNQGELFSGQFERINGAGQTLWLEANYNPVYDASGRLCKIVKFASDVTARVEKHAEDAQSATQAYHISQQTRDIAEKGAEVIQQTANGIHEIAADIESSSRLIAKLGERSQQITAIVNTIRAIADQTNLLALNAAIEAARAGDQGRGFAVVADEVRQLAARTSGSTAEISRMIEMIQSETRQAIDSMDNTRDRAAQGVDLANQAGTVILQIREGASDAVRAVSMFANDRVES